MATVNNRVRVRREQRGLSQVALAELTGLTRQSIGAIEASRATPSVDVALRIAASLDCSVEHLFGVESQVDAMVAESYQSHTEGRSTLARLAGRWVCYPIEASEFGTSADAIAVTTKVDKQRRMKVTPLRPLPELEENVVVMGCALGLGLLANRLNSRAGAGRFLWFSKSSTASLDALQAQQTHLAGVHLLDPRTGESNVSSVRRSFAHDPVTLITFGRWEMGLLVRRGAQKQIRHVSDLARPGVRFVGREQGAGAQRLFEREVRGQGLPVSLVRKPHVQVKSHLDVARAVAMGAADVGPGTRDAAIAMGLDFIPISEERFDLALRPLELADVRIQRLLDVLVSAEFRQELEVMGYDMTGTGSRVAETNVS